VTTNPDDEINAPNFPGKLYNKSNSTKSVWTAEVININFSLDHLHENIVLVYSRYGSETNDILLDGDLIASTIGPGEGIHKVFSIPLGALASGAHTVTLRYAGGGSDGGNFIDALGLRGSVPAYFQTPTWQIGTFDGATFPSIGGDEFETGAKFYQVYDYNVTTNPDDEIYAPNFPADLCDEPTDNNKWTAREVNISFYLPPLDNDFVLAYSRYGSEINDISLDGDWITSTVGPGEGVHRLFSVPLGALSSGAHTVTLRYAGGGSGGNHWIDAIGLCNSRVTYSIAGQVHNDSGEPIPDVTISTDSGDSATTNASGVYTITGLLTGTYTITPTKTNWAFEPPTRTVSVPPSTTGMDFTGSVVDPDMELAKRFAPYMYFHEDDIYRPITVTIPLKYGMLSNDAKGIYSVSPTLTDLTTPEWNDSDTYIDLAGDGPRVIRNYYNRDIRPQVEPLAFARVVTDGDDIAIQYWFYYYDNDWSNHHEGDWEMIQVVLDSDETPKYAAYSQHREHFGFSGPTRRLWEYVETKPENGGLHPRVYAARGSHASYFKQYNYYQKVGPIGGMDETGGNGLKQPIQIQILPDPPEDTWVYFQGHWGAKGSALKLGDDGPPSPSQHATEDRWKYPITWSEELTWDEDPLALHNQNKYAVSIESPGDVHVYKKPGGEHVGWKDGQVEEEIPTSEYFDNPTSGWRTIILHEFDINSAYQLDFTERTPTPQVTTRDVADDMTIILHFPDQEAGTTITSTYHLSQTWNVSTTGTISVHHGSDLHLRVDIDGDGEIDQDIPPTTMDETPFDFTASSPITDLAVLTATTESVALTWTAPGDDGYTGTVSAYDIRYYTDPITDANWVSATLIISPPVPSAAGTTEVFTITEIPCGRHYLAIQAVDDVLHYSELSNVVRVDIPCYLYLPLVLRNYEPLQPLQAGFVATPTTGTAPLIVTFTNTSTAADGGRGGLRRDSRPGPDGGDGPGGNQGIIRARPDIGRQRGRVLCDDDLNAVHREVGRCVAQGAPGGGYMLASCNSIFEGMNPIAVAEFFRYQKSVGFY
jgi:hypothetical protein